MLCYRPCSTICVFTAGWNIQANIGSFCEFEFHTSFLEYRSLSVSKIIKIHPGSTLCDKKVPAIIYDELVSGYHFPVCSRLTCIIQVYTSQIYARDVSSVPKSFFSNITPVAKGA